MSIQWTLISCVMWAELVLTSALLLPIISPRRWNSIFKSRMLRSISNMAHIYSKVFIFILILFFIDAIREMYKYGGSISDQKHEHQHHLDAQMQAHLHLFRAQRNFYITGFSLFLGFVLTRLMSLISKLAVTEAQQEAALKQAQSASQRASQLLDQGKQEEAKADQESANTVNEMKELQEEVKRLTKERDAALKQGEAVSREYDRLMSEHDKVQDELKVAQGSEASKKDD